MFNTMFTFNTTVLSLLVVCCARSWTQVFLIAFFEAVWVILLAITATLAPWMLEISLLNMALLYLTVSAAELVLFFLTFVIYYHVTNRGQPGANRLHGFSFYKKEFKKTKLYSHMV